MRHTFSNWLLEQIKISETNMLSTDRELHMLLGPYTLNDILPDSIPESHKQAIVHTNEELIKCTAELNTLNFVLQKFNNS